MLARLQTEQPPGPPDPYLTTQGVEELGLVPLADGQGGVLLPEEDAFVALDATPLVAISIEPGSPAPIGDVWQVELLSTLELAQVSFGIAAPPSTTTEQMRFTGCAESTAPPATERGCAANAALGPYVAPATSFTLGPQAALTGLRTDTLYVQLRGARPSGLALPALNVAGQPVLLGVVELDTTAVQPALTLDGIGTTAIFGTAYLETNGSPLPPPSVGIGAGYDAPSDFDADLRSDDPDNCPYTPNPDQANRGGFLTTNPDLYGDACQCGDIDMDGAVFPSDIMPLRQALALGLPDPSLVSRCSVIADDECEIRDVVVLNRTTTHLLPPSIVSACGSP